MMQDLNHATILKEQNGIYDNYIDLKITETELLKQQQLHQLGTPGSENSFADIDLFVIELKAEVYQARRQLERQLVNEHVHVSNE